MTCQEIKERLPLHAYGDVSAADASVLQTHLEGCAACQNELAQWQALRGVLDEAPPPTGEIKLPRIYYQAALRQGRRARLWRRCAAAALVGAACILTAALLRVQVSLADRQIAIRWGEEPVGTGIPVVNDEKPGVEKKPTEGGSYFGILRVLENGQKGEKAPLPYHQLLHGTIHSGMNYRKDAGKDADKGDWQRTPTTYYHLRFIPQAKSPWFSAAAEVRLPASLVALGAAEGIGPLPTSSLVGAWTEPPFATIGLGSGTMASYSWPFQGFNFYELDEEVRKLSLPTAPPVSPALLQYLREAALRGTDVEILVIELKKGK